MSVGRVQVLFATAGFRGREKPCLKTREVILNNFLYLFQLLRTLVGLTGLGGKRSLPVTSLKNTLADSSVLEHVGDEMYDVD